MDRYQQANYSPNYCRVCNSKVDCGPGATGATTKQEGDLSDCERAHCDIRFGPTAVLGVFMVLCESFFKRGGALAHTIEYRFTPPILGHTAFITRIHFQFSGLCFPHAAGSWRQLLFGA